MGGMAVGIVIGFVAGCFAWYLCDLEEERNVHNN